MKGIICSMFGTQCMDQMPHVFFAQYAVIIDTLVVGLSDAACPVLCMLLPSCLNQLVGCFALLLVCYPGCL